MHVNAASISLNRGLVFHTFSSTVSLCLLIKQIHIFSACQILMNVYIANALCVRFHSGGHVSVFTSQFR